MKTYLVTGLGPDRAPVRMHVIARSAWDAFDRAWDAAGGLWAARMRPIGGTR